jgi:hypothetical protein
MHNKSATSIPSSEKTKGFTQIPHGFHKRIAELKGARLAVWLVHRCMEGRAGSSWPSLATLETFTGYDRHAIQRARSWLRANGWLVKGGESRTDKGKFSVPVEHTAVPQAQNAPRDEGTKCAYGLAQNAPTVQAQNTAAVKQGTEVVPPSFEVDPFEADPGEVKATAPAPFSIAEDLKTKTDDELDSIPWNYKGLIASAVKRAVANERERRANQKYLGTSIDREDDIEDKEGSEIVTVEPSQWEREEKERIERRLEFLEQQKKARKLTPSETLEIGGLERLKKIILDKYSMPPVWEKPDHLEVPLFEAVIGESEFARCMQ